MDSRKGYIKLWRKLLDSKIFQNEGLLKVAIWCLLKANHKETWVPVKTGRGEKQVLVKPGQFIFGRHTAARELNMSPSSTRNRLQLLRNARFMDTQMDTHYSIITIINWDTYQADEEKKDRQEDNQRTNKGHRQECKEYINKFNCKFFEISEKEFLKHQKLYPQVNLLSEYQHILDWLKANPAKQKTPEDFSRLISFWLQRAANPSEFYEQRKAQIAQKPVDNSPSFYKPWQGPNLPKPEERVSTNEISSFNKEFKKCTVH
ncbi:MAG: hypothetical protein JSW07_16360 [bacterium]|nr:MAG: hypothetical protein JSW07_16360 [bacterium]